MLARRSFLIGLASAFAAPAIVRASSLMPVKVTKPDLPLVYEVPPYGLGPAMDALPDIRLLQWGRSVINFRSDLSDLGEPYRPIVAALLRKPDARFAVTHKGEIIRLLPSPSSPAPASRSFPWTPRPASRA